MSETLPKTSLPPPAKKIYRKGDEYVCGMCHARYSSLEDTKACLIRDVRDQEAKKPAATEERKYRCGHCRNVYTSKEMARDCAARCKRLSEEKPDPIAPTSKPRRPERQPKIQVPHWALKKCMKDGEVLVCKGCGAEYASVRDVIACFDIHPPLPPGQKPRTPDRMKYRTVGGQYQCRYCNHLHGTVAKVVVCYDSHNEEREAKQAARDARKARATGRSPRKRRLPSNPNQSESLAESYTLGERIDSSDDEDYRIYSDTDDDDGEDGYTIDGDWSSPTDSDDYEDGYENPGRESQVVRISGYDGRARVDRDGYLLDKEGSPLKRKGEYYLDSKGHRIKANSEGYVIDAQGGRYGPDADGYLIDADWASKKQSQESYRISSERYGDAMADADSSIESGAHGSEHEGSRRPSSREGYSISSTGSYRKKDEATYTIHSTGPGGRKDTVYTIESEAPRPKNLSTQQPSYIISAGITAPRNSQGKALLGDQAEADFHAANLENIAVENSVKSSVKLVLPTDVAFSDYSDLREFGDEQLIAQLDEAPVGTELAAQRSRERRKFLRAGIKYQCKACGTRYYLKKEVLACFDGHRR